MFSSRNKKTIMWIPPLICSYAVVCLTADPGVAIEYQLNHIVHINVMKTDHEIISVVTLPLPLIIDSCQVLAMVIALINHFEDCACSGKV